MELYTLIDPEYENPIDIFLPWFLAVALMVMVFIIDYLLHGED